MLLQYVLWPLLGHWAAANPHSIHQTRRSTKVVPISSRQPVRDTGVLPPGSKTLAVVGLRVRDTGSGRPQSQWHRQRSASESVTLAAVGLRVSDTGSVRPQSSKHWQWSASRVRTLAVVGLTSSKHWQWSASESVGSGRPQSSNTGSGRPHEFETLAVVSLRVCDTGSGRPQSSNTGSGRSQGSKHWQRSASEFEHWQRSVSGFETLATFVIRVPDRLTACSSLFSVSLHRKIYRLTPTYRLTGIYEDDLRN